MDALGSKGRGSENQQQSGEYDERAKAQTQPGEVPSEHVVSFHQLQLSGWALWACPAIGIEDYPTPGEDALRPVV